jgi:hypothetical protein
MLKKGRTSSAHFMIPTFPDVAYLRSSRKYSSAAFYLSKMNLLLCKENKCFSVFPNCPADIAMRKQLSAWKSCLKKDATDFQFSKHPVGSSTDDDMYLNLLRLKGMEIYFGKDMAVRLARKAGLSKTPSDDEIRPIACLFLLRLLIADDAEQMLPLHREPDIQRPVLR